MSGWSDAAGLTRLMVGIAVLVAGTSAAGAASAQRSEDVAAQRVIRVSGSGEVRITPDVAQIDLAVETTATTARAAGEQNARSMDRLVQAMMQAGIARADLRTRGYSLIPVYAQPERPPRPEPVQQQEPRIVGYRASNVLTVRTSDVARLGALIDAGLAAGANRMQQLRFSVQDSEAAQNQASREAAERARRTAEAIAAALGVRLGVLVEASTTAEPVRPMMMAEFHSADRAMATPIEPGEQSVAATVVLVFAIDD